MQKGAKNTLIPFVLALCLAISGSVRAADVVPAEGRKDILRKVLAFHELEVPTRDGGTRRLAVTVLETFDHEFFDEDLPRQPLLGEQAERQRLKRHVVETVQDWYERHLTENGPGGPLDESFRATLRNEQSIYNGNNTMIIFSNPDDFSDIQALLRVAKRSPAYPLLPVERQLKRQLSFLPSGNYKRVRDDRVKLYSYRHSEPHYMEVQNATVYRGDAVELKHYSAVRSRDVDLTALLFHVAQEIGALSIIGLRNGRDLKVPEPACLVTPAYFVAESDNPGVIKQLTSFGFQVQLELSGTIHPEQTTHILMGTQEQLGQGFFDWNENRRNSWQLPQAKLKPREDTAFLKSLFGARCSHKLVNALHRLDERAQRRLQNGIDRATGNDRK